MRKLTSLAVFLVAVFGFSTAAQADVFIDFNDLDHGVEVTNQYSGVSFELAGQPGQGPITYALKDGGVANTGNKVTVLNIADERAITPFNPQNGFNTNCSEPPFVPCEDFIITFDTPINYFSILALDAEEAFTATAYLGNTPVTIVNQGMFLGNNSASVFNGPVYRVEFGAFDGPNAFDKIVIDITDGGPELFDNIRYNRLDDPRLRVAEPDRFPLGTDLRDKFPGITLSVTGRPDATIPSIDGFKAIPGTGITRYLSTTGSLLFGNPAPPGAPIQSGEPWGDEYYGNLRVDFDVPTDFVQIDLIHGDDGISVLRAYDAAGNLLQQIRELGNGVGSQGDDCPSFCEPVITASITRASPDIAYVVAGGEGFEPCLLDNLQYNLMTADPPNLILNGSFEIPLVVDTGLHYEHRNGAELTGWTSYSTYKGTVQFNSLYGPVTDGNQAVQIEVGRDSISQSFSTVIGGVYELSFDLSAYDGFARIGQLNVTVGPASASYTGLAEAYVRETLRFTADSAVTTLRFENAFPMSAWYNYPHIDNVSIVAVSVHEVNIDIKPGSDPNCLNINDHGVIPVAVLGSADFDVSSIDPATLVFAGLVPREKKDGRLSCSYEDVNIDGYPDLVCQFVDDAAAWAPDSDTATLRGELTDGTPIAGSDSICLVPKNGPPANGKEAPPLDPRPWW